MFYRNILFTAFISCRYDMFLIRNAMLECVCIFPLSCVFLFATHSTVACQAPLSMEFSRQKYCSGLPFPTPGIKPASLVPPTLASRFFTTAPPRKPRKPLHTHKEELLCVTLLLTPSELYSGYP